MVKREFIIDGAKFGTLAEAAAEFTRALGLEPPWRGNLDAFNDMLNGGFGTPDDGFVLIWRRSDKSRQRLAFPETLLWLKERVENCHPANAAQFKSRIIAAQRGEGKTLFDMLVEIIRGHEDIELRLE